MDGDSCKIVVVLIVLRQPGDVLPRLQVLVEKVFVDHLVQACAGSADTGCVQVQVGGVGNWAADGDVEGLGTLSRFFAHGHLRFFLNLNDDLLLNLNGDHFLYD